MAKPCAAQQGTGLPDANIQSIQGRVGFPITEETGFEISAHFIVASNASLEFVDSGTAIAASHAISQRKKVSCRVVIQVDDDHLQIAKFSVS